MFQVADESKILIPKTYNKKINMEIFMLCDFQTNADIHQWTEANLVEVTICRQRLLSHTFMEPLTFITLWDHQNK